MLRAIKYRQKEIIRIIRRKGALESLVPQITHKGRTILHEVARIDYYKAGHLAGVAFQLQDELRWYDVRLLTFNLDEIFFFNTFRIIYHVINFNI